MTDLDNAKVVVTYSFGHLTVRPSLPSVTLDGPGCCGPTYSSGYSFGDLLLILAATFGGWAAAWIGLALLSMAVRS